jgi:hypothetical protein
VIGRLDVTYHVVRVHEGAHPRWVASVNVGVPALRLGVVASAADDQPCDALAVAVLNALRKIEGASPNWLPTE